MIESERIRVTPELITDVDTLRILRGWSRNKLRRKAKLSGSTLNNLLNKPGSAIEARTLASILDALNIDPENQRQIFKSYNAMPFTEDGYTRLVRKIFEKPQ